MKQQSTIEARFYPECAFSREGIRHGMPRGDERGGPAVCWNDDGAYWVEGELRDFKDEESPAALAWFISVCRGSEAGIGRMVLTIADGPRYRYVWQNGHCTKLMGLLDL